MTSLQKIWSCTAVSKSWQLLAEMFSLARHFTVQLKQTLQHACSLCVRHNWTQLTKPQCSVMCDKIIVVSWYLPKDVHVARWSVTGKNDWGTFMTVCAEKSHSKCTFKLHTAECAYSCLSLDRLLSSLFICCCTANVNTSCLAAGDKRVVKQWRTVDTVYLFLQMSYLHIYVAVQQNLHTKLSGPHNM